MKARIKQILQLPEIPSASGIEVVHPYIYIIGDDSNFLFVLDREYRLVKKIELYKAKTKDDGRIKKSKKADLETITSLQYKEEGYILIMGSGSTNLRETSFIISANPPFEVQEFSLSTLFAHLREDPEIVGNGKLNIEGLASDEKSIYLFQRGNISGNNVLISFDKDLLLSHMMGSALMGLPPYGLKTVELPSLEHIPSGFSGACAIPDSTLLLFTASVENTANEIDDGRILGSFLGTYDLRDENTPEMYRLSYNESLYLGKLESIAILKKDGSQITALAVSDMDGGVSELLEVEISL